MTPEADTADIAETADIADIFIDAALAAGRTIMAVYERGHSLRIKPDNTPVTDADDAAEAAILTRLADALPHIPAVSEEEAQRSGVPKVESRYILVDPLDGTREFVKGNGEFTVNIALVEQGCPRVGVVYAPAFGEIFWADGKGAAWRADVADGALQRRQRITVRRVPECGATIIASRSHLTPDTEDLIGNFTVSERLAVGSSLKLCRLAEGRADIYPRAAPTMQWDTAAAHAVLRAAGGRIVVAGCRDELAYDLCADAKVSDLKNPHFVALGDSTLEGEL